MTPGPRYWLSYGSSECHWLCFSPLTLVYCTAFYNPHHNDLQLHSVVYPHHTGLNHHSGLDPRSGLNSHKGLNHYNGLYPYIRLHNHNGLNHQSGINYRSGLDPDHYGLNRHIGFDPSSGQKYYSDLHPDHSGLNHYRDVNDHICLIHLIILNRHNGLDPYHSGVNLHPQWSRLSVWFMFSEESRSSRWSTYSQWCR